MLVLVALFALFGGSVAQWSNEELDCTSWARSPRWAQPSLANGHYFGTDDLGRDLFARTVQGTQISLIVGVVGALIAVIVGTLYGATSGYVGGRVDELMMRLRRYPDGRSPTCSC